MTRAEDLAVLKLSEGVSPQEIRQKYKHLARRDHPDNAFRMPTSACLGQERRAAEAKHMKTRAPLEIIIATMIKMTSRATFGITNTTISSSEDGIQDTNTTGTEILAMETQIMMMTMMMTTLITGMKQQERRMRDDAKKI
jgi:hypothetical protein